MPSCLAALVLLALLSAIAVADDRNHKKRQIYREQVVPHSGGRIPETAFETDRLFLNRLQKEGIALPDGIVLEQRNPQVYPHTAKSARTVYRIALSSDGRYTPEEGKPHYQTVPSVETTYLYPPIYGQKSRVPQPQPRPAYPIYRQFQLHNSQLNQVKLQPRKKGQFVSAAHASQKYRAKPPKRPESYQNFSIINAPVDSQPSAPQLPSVLPTLKPPTRSKPTPTPTATATPTPPPTPAKSPIVATDSKYYLPNYGSQHAFHDFDELFNNFNLHESADRSFYRKPQARANPAIPTTF